MPTTVLPESTRRLIAEQRGVAIDEVPEHAQPNSVHLQYRFLGRTNVPALNIIQLIDHRTERIQLQLAEGDCGEALWIKGVQVLYGEGYGSLLPSEEAGRWLACPAFGELILGNVVFALDTRIVEIKALPEAGISKEQLLRITESMID